MSSTSLFGRFSNFGTSPQHSRVYNTRLPDWEAGKHIGDSAARGKKPSSSDLFEEPMLRHEGDIELQSPAKPSEQVF